MRRCIKIICSVKEGRKERAIKEDKENRKRLLTGKGKEYQASVLEKEIKRL